MFKGATVLMAAGMIATTSAPAVRAAAPSVMSIVQQAMNMGVAATVVDSGTWCKEYEGAADSINYTLDSDGVLRLSGNGVLGSYAPNGSFNQFDRAQDVKKIIIDDSIKQTVGYAIFDLQTFSNLYEIQGCNNFSESDARIISPANYYGSGRKPVFKLDTTNENFKNAFAEAYKDSLILTDQVWNVAYAYLTSQSYNGSKYAHIIVYNDGTLEIKDMAYLAGYKQNIQSTGVQINTIKVINERGELQLEGLDDVCSNTETIDASEIGCKTVRITGIGSVKNVILPDDITNLSISNLAIKDISIPQTVTTLSLYNVGISKLDIPEGVTSASVQGCGNLEELIIPDSITSLNSSSFTRLSKLNTIRGGNNITSLGQYIFTDEIKRNVDLYTDNDLLLDYGWIFDNINVTKHTNVTPLDSGTTSDYNGISGATYELKSNGVLTITGSYKGIGNDFFSDSYQYKDQIKKLVIKGSVYIGERAFKNCTNLASMTIDQNDGRVYEICANAFENTGLTQIDLSRQNSIGDEAFKNCNKLTKIIWNRDDIRSIGNNAFYCSESVNTDLQTTSNKLKAYDWVGSNRIVDPSQTEVQYKEYRGNLNNQSISYVLDATGTLTFYPNGTTVFPSTGASMNIGEDHYPVKKMVFESGFEELGYSCLNNNGINNVAQDTCEEVVLPDTLKTVNNGVFNRYKMREVTIPDSVTKINDGSFTSCNNLETINGMGGLSSVYWNYILYTGTDGPKVTTINTSNTELIKQMLWKADPNDDMSFLESGANRKFKIGTLTIGNDTTVKKVDDTTIQIDGTGNIGNDSLSGISGTSSKIDTVIIGDGVTQIGNNAFANNPGIKDIQGGSNVTDIADNAFAMDDYSIATQPLVVESKAVYDNIVKKTQRKNVSLKNSGSTTPVTPGTVTPPLTPAAENWSYSDVNSQFETDKFSIPSETADWNIIMNENYNVNGLSEKQGYKSMYSKATSNNEDTVVVCDKASHWMIAIPKDIILDGASAESTADYRVGIAGEVDPAKRVTVTPDQTVTLVNQGNDQITYVATVDQPVTGVNGFDIVENFADAGDTLMNGHISATIKRAGSYKGNMSFAIDYVDFISTPESATQG